jgi:pentose-5-phosphate-3-epimerase
MATVERELAILHLGAKTYTRGCCEQIKDLGCKAGVVLNPATPLGSIENVLSFVGAQCERAPRSPCRPVFAPWCFC